MVSRLAKHCSGVLVPLLLFAFIKNVRAGCCSNDYKECDVWWCGETKSECENCGGDQFTFLEDGEVTETCLARWSGCFDNIAGCCDGLTCQQLSQYYWQCLPGENESQDESTDPPTDAPTREPNTDSPTDAPTREPNTDSPTDAPTREPNCGCQSCNNEVLFRVADGYLCGDRIDWLITQNGYSEYDACSLVAGDEFPDICGGCDPGTCNIESTPSPTDAPVEPTDAPVAPTPRPSLRATSSPTKSPPVDNGPKCGCESCNDSVLDRLVGPYSCGSRIDYLINEGSPENEACVRVAGDEFSDICGDCDPNTCNLPPVESPTRPPSSTIPVDEIDWDGNDLVLTHYWDCSGQSCDAGTLSPWNYDKYRTPSGYQPQDPEDFGGPSEYGEKLWVTAAIMNIDQGSDDGCCGQTGEGGCGKCILISNPDSLNPDWTVMAMKKNTCGNCGSNKHADINVPGFDVLQYSLANICGAPDTGMSEEQSTVLGSWYNDFSNVRDAGAARCGLLPAEFQKGCSVFSEWGWTGGKTSRAKYKVVDCPEQFKQHIEPLFDEGGIVF